MNFNQLIEANHININRISNMDPLFGRPKTLLPFGGEEEKPVVEKIIDLLMHPFIRRGDDYNLDYKTGQKYREKINKFIDNATPIEFVFQGFPFKCHNPFETMRRTPDLGEISLLQRLLDINETLKQVYQPGVNFTVLAEGKTYQDLFGASSDEVRVYQERIKDFCQKMGIQEVVEIRDFMDILDNPQEFLDKCKVYEKRLNDSKDIEPLLQVMMRSLPVSEKMKIKDLLAVFGATPIDDLSKTQLDIFCRLSDRARDTAIKYLAIQKVKKENQLIDRAFPDKLYVTTLPRMGIYAFHPIHRKTRLFPQHGVPILEADKVDVVFLGEILARPTRYTVVYLDDDIEDAPFYFLKGSQHICKYYLPV